MSVAGLGYGSVGGASSRACLEDPLADSQPAETLDETSDITIGELPSTPSNCLAVRVACRAMHTYCTKYSQRVNKKLFLVVMLIVLTALGAITGYKTYGHPGGTVSGALGGVSVASLFVCLLTYGDECINRCRFPFLK